jgi:hypothetical protein
MLEEYEHKKSESAHHSQLNQDGIIEEIFNRIGTTNKFFIEFGSRLPWMLNSSYLRHHKQWTGLMFDASDGKANFFKKTSWRQYRRSYFSSEADWHEAVKGFELIKKNTPINSTNINNVFNSYDAPSVFDLLSIDIDGQDYWAWEGLDESRFKPRVVSIEFDFSLGSQDSLVEPKDEGTQGSSWPPCMCSLKALDELAKSKGYSYVYSLRPHEIFRPSRMAGTHAFFVLNEELNDNLRAQELFQYKKESVGYRKQTRQHSKCKFVQV